MRIEIQDRGIMLSDYFSGTSGVMLPLSVDNTTTFSEVIELLISEINMVFNHIEYTAEYHGFNDDLSQAIDTEINTIKEENAHRLLKVAFPDVGFSFDDEKEDIDFFDLPVLILTIEFLDN